MEVIVTVFIVSIVLGLMFVSLFLISSASKDLISVNAKYAGIMKGYFQLRKQLIAVYKSENVPYILKGGQKEDGDRLEFITAAPAVFQGVVEAQYQIKKDKNGANYLAYRELPYPGYKMPQNDENNDKGWEAFSKKITGLTIDYAKGGFWFKSWDEKNCPEKIRITLHYPERGIEKKFSFIVVPGLIEFKEIIKTGKENTENAEQKDKEQTTGNTEGN